MGVCNDEAGLLCQKALTEWIEKSYPTTVTEVDQSPVAVKVEDPNELHRTSL